VNKRTIHTKASRHGNGQARFCPNLIGNADVYRRRYIIQFIRCKNGSQVVSRPIFGRVNKRRHLRLENLCNGGTAFEVFIGDRGSAGTGSQRGIGTR